MEFTSVSQLIFGRSETVPDSPRDYDLKLAKAITDNAILEDLGAAQTLTLKPGDDEHTQVRRHFGKYFYAMYEDNRPNASDTAEEAYLDPHDGILNRYGWRTVPSALVPKKASVALRRLERTREYAAERGLKMPTHPKGLLPDCMQILADEEGVSRQAFTESVRKGLEIEAARAKAGI